MTNASPDWTFNLSLSRSKNQNRRDKKNAEDKKIVKEKKEVVSL